MDKTLVPYIIFEMAPMGTLQVYSLRPAGDTSPIDTFYWRDAGSPYGFGPFTSVYEAMQHYKAINQFFKTNADGSRMLPASVPTIMPKNNVVYVDFKTKKRIG